VTAWLLKTLLVQCEPLHHLRVVLAGRPLQPSPNPADYNFLYQYHTLAPVTEQSEYIGYCRALGLPLSAEEIALFVQATEHKPGLFVELVENSQQTGGR
jgi:hypothetical protein